MVQGRVSTAALCVLALALQTSFAHETAAPTKKDLLADCEAPGYFKTVDPTGVCGIFHCSSTTGEAPYCPCPFMYKVSISKQTYSTRIA
jgi:hypothetical protein